RLVEAAIAVVRALLSDTMTIVHRHWLPVASGQQLLPVIPVSVPFTGADLAEHALIKLQRMVIGSAEGFTVKISHGGQAGIALQQQIQPRKAQIATPTFGQGEAELQIAMTLDVRQILE